MAECVCTVLRCAFFISIYYSRNSFVFLFASPRSWSGDFSIYFFRLFSARNGNKFQVQLRRRYIAHKTRTGEVQCVSLETPSAISRAVGVGAHSTHNARNPIHFVAFDIQRIRLNQYVNWIVTYEIRMFVCSWPLPNSPIQLLPNNNCRKIITFGFGGRSAATPKLEFQFTNFPFFSMNLSFRVARIPQMIRRSTHHFSAHFPNRKIYFHIQMRNFFFVVVAPCTRLEFESNAKSRMIKIECSRHYFGNKWKLKWIRGAMPPYSGPFMAQMSIQNEMIVGLAVWLRQKTLSFHRRTVHMWMRVAMKPLSTHTQATPARGGWSLLRHKVGRMQMASASSTTSHSILSRTRNSLFLCSFFCWCVVALAHKRTMRYTLRWWIDACATCTQNRPDPKHNARNR